MQRASACSHLVNLNPNLAIDGRFGVPTYRTAGLTVRKLDSLFNPRGTEATRTHARGVAISLAVSPDLPKARRSKARKLKDSQHELQDSIDLTSGWQGMRIRSTPSFLANQG